MTFIDTWAWLALADKKDNNHNIAKKTYDGSSSIDFNNPEGIKVCLEHLCNLIEAL